MACRCEACVVYEDGYDTGRAEERAAIVSWLLEPKPNITIHGEMLLINMAGAIDEGEHVKAEEK